MMLFVIKLWNSLLFVLDAIPFSIVTVVLTLYYFALMMFPSKKKDIKGQLALVTGGGNGLGRSISLALAAKGCDVIILDVDVNGGEETAVEIRKLHSVKAYFFKVDVSKFNEIQNIRLLIENEIGEVDILVNNAGILSEISLMEGTENDIERVIQVNLASSFWTIREFIKSMFRRNSGHIVAISSLSAYDALGRQLVYSSTKYAIRGLMEALQEELRIEKSNIVATTVYPGFTRTRPDLIDYMHRALKKPSHLEYLTPDGVADAVINAIVYNKLYVTVPSYYLLMVTLMRLFPVQVQNRFRDKYKPILYNSCVTELEVPLNCH